MDECGRLAEILAKKTGGIKKRMPPGAGSIRFMFRPLLSSGSRKQAFSGFYHLFNQVDIRKDDLSFIGPDPLFVFFCFDSPGLRRQNGKISVGANTCGDQQTKQNSAGARLFHCRKF